MKKLFVKAIEWLRRRVTAFKSEKLRVKSEKVENTQGLSANENEDVNDDRLKGKGGKVIVNSQFSIVNSRITIPEVEQLLRAKYDLRYNLLTEQSEYRAKGSDAAYEAVTQRVYKTWMADLQADGHNVWWVEGVRIAAESMHIEPYHPVKHYFATLPQWDGTDRLRPLMQRLTTDEVLVDYLCRWMLAFVAQAQGREEALYANSVAPILISEQQ